MAERVCVAQIGAAHGVRGEVRLWSFTEDPLAVADYGVLESEDGKRHFAIESLRPAKECLVVRLSGVADRNAAEALRNVKLYVPRDRLPAIDDAETFYHADLIGLAATAADGSKVGTVIAVHNFGAGDLLEIAPEGGGETMLLPFSATAVPLVDIAGGRIVVVPPHESVEADEAAQEEEGEAPKASEP